MEIGVFIKVLPEQNRLKKKKDFERINKQGRVISGDFLVLKKLKNDMNHSRIGLVVPLKISKKAVVRNKAKRRLREIIRENLDEMKPGYDLVFFTRKGIEEKDFNEINLELKTLFKKAKLTKF